MGRWLDALKKHENTTNANPQNPQNPQNSGNRGFEGFESFNSTGSRKNSDAVSDERQAAQHSQKTEEPLFCVSPRTEASAGKAGRFMERSLK